MNIEIVLDVRWARAGFTRREHWSRQGDRGVYAEIRPADQVAFTAGSTLSTVGLDLRPRNRWEMRGD